MSHLDHNKLTAGGLLVTMGIVYGDIGTSPLYVMKAITTGETISKELVYGGVSAVFWTLMILTTFKYVYLALNADNRGEGGIFALYALVRRYRTKWIIYPAIIGCASLIADGFITPPISVASAIEGLANLGVRNGIDFSAIETVPIVLAILIALFIIQQFGTNFVGKAFGPIMLIWFVMLAGLGMIQILKNPSVIEALNPIYAIKMVTIYRNQLTGAHGFWLLGSVFLCTTGGEALYSDLGHCGKQNIRISWIVIFICLTINYLGQASYLLTNHLNTEFTGRSVFYATMSADFLPYGIGIATLAAIIASQALISGCFTLVNEAMKLKLWPNMKVNYPTQLKGQIYMPSINWFLLAGCIAVVLVFRESGKMEAAYGLAIVLNMLMTTTLLLHFMHMKRRPIWQIVVLGLLLFVIEGAFMVSNLAKFSHGGWFSVMLAAVLFFGIFMWYKAKELRRRHLSVVSIDPYIPMLKDLMNDDTVPKEATNLVYLTMSGEQSKIDSNIIYSIFRKRPKRADIYWFVHVDICDEPYVKQYKVTTIVPQKVFFVRLKFGFKVEHKVNLMFNKIVRDMQNMNEVDELSHYPSLRKHRFNADFKFIILNSRASVDDEISPFDQFTIRTYRLLKKLSLPTTEDFGLEVSNVEVETVPINIGKTKGIELKREY
ncbi:MAG: KUP/HAK/KT family potassium transporter [Saprospiraceae bacterium]|nr:KUP/HAK/KT family potassium transporter [Saprospiraceae bacterium]